jgi:hypothetical protein
MLFRLSVVSPRCCICVSVVYWRWDCFGGLYFGGRALFYSVEGSGYYFLNEGVDIIF